MAKPYLKYSVVRDTRWDDVKGKTVAFTVPGTRGFDFWITGCTSRSEEMLLEDSFIECLRDDTGIDASGCGFGSGDDYFDTETGKTEEASYFSIPVEDGEEKKDVQEAYARWKKNILPALVSEWAEKRFPLHGTVSAIINCGDIVRPKGAAEGRESCPFAGVCAFQSCGKAGTQVVNSRISGWHMAEDPITAEPHIEAEIENLNVNSMVKDIGKTIFLCRNDAEKGLAKMTRVQLK